jgi:hypothetical protein
MESVWGDRAPKTVIDIAGLVTDGQRGHRVKAQILWTAIVMCLPTTVVGIASAVSESVAARYRDLTMHILLGGRPLAVRWMAVTPVLRAVGFGITIGTFIGILLARLIRSQLYGVPAVNPVSIVLATLIVTLGTLAGVAVPLRQLGAQQFSSLLRQETRH